MSARILIVDDEVLLRAQLREALVTVWPDALIVGEAGNGVAALAMIESVQPDLVFMDIQMPGLSGLDVVKNIGPGIQVVFVTAYDQYAINAFEEGAIDYILKPVEPARLLKTIKRLKSRVTQTDIDSSDSISPTDPALESPKSQPKALTWIQASVGNTIHFIMISDVLYFQAEDKYTKVVTYKMTAYIRKSIKELLDELPTDKFWQINRGIIVSVEHIESAKRETDGNVRLKMKEHAALLPVSQTWQARFRQM